MKWRPVTVTLAAMALMAVSAAEAVAQAPTYGGGRLPTAAPPGGYEPSMGVSLQPRGDRIAVRFDSSVLCGRDVFDVVGRRTVPFDGTTFSAQGASVKSVARGRLTFQWTLSGQLSGGIVRGVLRVVGVRRKSGRGRACATKPERPFEARLAGPPAGAPAQPPSRGFYAGTSLYEIVDGLQSPVILRASRDARKIAARWTIAAKCRRGPRDGFVNYTPPTRVGPRGGFLRKERFSVRYLDVLIRYRTSFAGRIASDGATGTLRLRTRIYNRSGTRLLTRCDSGKRRWNAALVPPA